MEDLIKAMSVSELQTFKNQYKDNESIQKIVDGYIAIKTQEAEQAKAMESFSKAIDKLVNKLPHPETVHNVYLGWREVDVEDTSQPAVEVDIITEPAEVNSDGMIVKEAVKATESRYPMTKAWRWNVELNKGFAPAKASSGNAVTTVSKRAITVKRILDDAAPELIGNFRSAKEACQHLNLIVGTDSAMRVLTNRNPYMAIAYEGTDFKVSES